MFSRMPWARRMLWRKRNGPRRPIVNWTRDADAAAEAEQPPPADVPPDARSEADAEQPPPDHIQRMPGAMRKLRRKRKGMGQVGRSASSSSSVRSHVPGTGRGASPSIIAGILRNSCSARA
jgi:hypothetical protein